MLRYIDVMKFRSINIDTDLSVTARMEYSHMMSIANDTKSIFNLFEGASDRMVKLDDEDRGAEFIEYILSVRVMFLDFYSVVVRNDVNNMKAFYDAFLTLFAKNIKEVEIFSHLKDEMKGIGLNELTDEEAEEITLFTIIKTAAECSPSKAMINGRPRSAMIRCMHSRMKASEIHKTYKDIAEETSATALIQKGTII